MAPYLSIAVGGVTLLGPRDLVAQRRAEGLFGAEQCAGAREVEQRPQLLQIVLCPRWCVMGAGDANGKSSAVMTEEHSPTRVSQENAMHSTLCNTAVGASLRSYLHGCARQ